MPRLLGKLPAYRHHKSTGQAVVTLGGRDYYLGQWKSAASKAEYSRITREWMAGGVADGNGGDQFTIVELLAAFSATPRDTTSDPMARRRASWRASRH